MPDPTALARLLRDESVPLDKMSHSELYMRRARTTDPEEQRRLARLEHQAFSREATAEKPWLAAAIPPASLAYFLAKKSGAVRSRTPADWSQVEGAFTGVGEGLRDYFK